MKGKYLKVLLLAIITFLAINAFSQEEEPIRWTIKSAVTTPVKEGDKFSVEVTAVINEGWHLYSLEQPPGGPLATRLTVPPNQAFKLAGEIESPPAKTVFDANFNMPVEFYEHEATFTLPIGVLADSSEGKRNLLVNAFFQTCSRRTCLPPKSIKLSVSMDSPNKTANGK